MQQSMAMASQVVLLAETEGSKRFCVDYQELDYQELNSAPVKYVFRLPHTDDSLDYPVLSGSQC